MKKLLLTAAVMMVAVAVHGQGQVNFSNRGTGVDAPIFNVDGTTRLSGATFQAQLYGGPQGTAAASLTAAGAATGFQTGTLAGYFFGGTARSITGVAGGSVATLQVRVWDSTTGATWETATTRSSINDGIVSITLGTPPNTPPNLTGLASFSLVPEPSTIALGIFGAAALLLARRRK
jgi:hypothetical protein